MKMNTTIFLHWAVILLLANYTNNAFATEQILAVGVDRKFTYNEQKDTYEGLAPGHDEVIFYSLALPEKPKLIGNLSIDNSIIGPPTNIAISPDQRFALVASAIKTVPDGQGKGWKMKPDNTVAVVDLENRPIRVVQKVTVGNQPSGMAIDSSGTLALVANRRDNSVSVLSIVDKSVSVTQTVDVGGEVTSVAISPTREKALAVKVNEHSIAELKIEEDGNVSYDGRDIPVGLYPWTVAISEDGGFALVTNIGKKGAADGNAKTVSVIDLKVKPIRVVRHISVGDAPEGVAISPNGRFAAVSLLAGSYAAPKKSWYRRPKGQLSLLDLDNEMKSISSTVDVGSFPEGVAFSSDGSHVYVGNFADATLSLITLSDDGSVRSMDEIKLPGSPGSLRVAGQ